MLQRPPESVDLPNEDCVEPPPASVGHESIERRPGLLGARNPLIDVFLADLPAPTPRVLTQFSELHLWILIVECADSGVQRNLSDRASGFWSDSSATLLSSHCCLLF